MALNPIDGGKSINLHKNYSCPWAEMQNHISAEQRKKKKARNTFRQSNVWYLIITLWN